MAFKTKKKSRQIIDDRQTLDAKHNNILQLFTENKNSISELQIELNNIISVINDLNIENAKSEIYSQSDMNSSKNDVFSQKTSDIEEIRRKLAETSIELQE